MNEPATPFCYAPTTSWTSLERVPNRWLGDVETLFSDRLDSEVTYRPLFDSRRAKIAPTQNPGTTAVYPNPQGAPQEVQKKGVPVERTP